MDLNAMDTQLDLEISKNDTEFLPVGEIPIVYMITTNADIHKGRIKIGKAHITENDLSKDLSDNSEFLESIARERTKDYCNTTGLKVKLYFVGLRKHPLKAGYLWDHDVHDVLEASGISHVDFPGSSAREWYEISIDVALNALQAAAEGRQYLTGDEKKVVSKEIVLREEQEDAIERTLAHFEDGGRRMLWNAKMRFGKTITALALVRQKKFKRVLLATHRPAVNDGWAKDFQLIFPKNDYLYGSKKDGQEDVKYPLADILKQEKPFVYFMSIQDLRGSKIVNEEKGKEKNLDIFSTKWDLVVVDEAHEGTTTELARNLFAVLKSEYVISLSGTPFNLLSQYNENEVFTWDYIAEQKRKRQWPLYHGAEENPYIGLPEMRMYAYDLAATMPEYRSKEIHDESWFSFAEFFRVDDETGKFVHEADVDKFLTLISTEKEWSSYPFSSREKQNMFRHTFWRIPGVKEGEALKKRMMAHHFFCQYAICNVAGDDGDYTVDGKKVKEPLDYVRKQIKTVEEDLAKPEEDRIIRREGTITLSCGKLTTGVSVPEWTGVFMLSGGEEISASHYLQTIFRVQTPYTSPRTGAMKAYAYVFDFAPDRFLRVLTTSLRINSEKPEPPPEGGDDGGGLPPDGGIPPTGGGPSSGSDFPKYCALIIEKDSKLARYDAHAMLRAVNRIQSLEALRTGFNTNKIFTPAFLNGVTAEDIKKYEGIVKKIFKASSGAPTTIVRISSTTDPKKPAPAKGPKRGGVVRPGRPKGEGEKREKSAFEKAKEQLFSAFKMLLARLPLLIFASDEAFTEDFSLNDFIDRVDDLSWKEFLPITKDEFKQISPVINSIAIADAGYMCRELAKGADCLPPEERIVKIAELIARFKNPDKETVLTPWRVVNMHLSDTIGGWCFFDETFKEENPLEDPRFVNREDVTENIFKPNTTVLEMNAKTGLYSLYVAFSIFKKECEIALAREGNLTRDIQKNLWRKVVEENLCILCGTKMAAAIARRTLLGYQEGNLNVCTIEDLSVKLKKNPQKIVNRIKNPQTWNKKGVSAMEFDAIVGNPPYQINIGVEKENYAIPIYHKFVEIAKDLKPQYLSLIIPARWYAGGRGLDEFRKNMLTDRETIQIHDYPDSTDCFPRVDIAGGICYFLWEKGRSDDCLIRSYRKGCAPTELKRPLLESGLDTFIRHNDSISILHKVRDKNEETFDNLVSPQTPFGFVSSFKDYTLKPFKNGVKIYTVKGPGYVKREDIKKGEALINAHKVYIAKSYGERGAYPFFFLAKPFYGEPNSCCTQTYLAIGPFSQETEAKNVMSYIRTRFFRFCVMLKRNTQDAMRGVYQFVPMQDFSKPWTDEELYAKYGLTDEEIAFIESMIRPMVIDKES